MHRPLHATARLATLLALSALGGCAHLVPGRQGAARRSAWQATRTSAERSAVAGRHAEADSALAHFAQASPGTAEAREALYWRALYRMDPANRAGSAREAVLLFDQYLADTLSEHVLEAAVLRRSAAEADSLERQVASLRSAIDAATTREGRATERASKEDRSDKGRAEELARLREELASTKSELASTKDELDRIKKRLATPRP